LPLPPSGSLDNAEVVALKEETIHQKNCEIAKLIDENENLRKQIQQGSSSSSTKIAPADDQVFSSSSVQNCY
jgi:hypothetical protein